MANVSASMNALKGIRRAARAEAGVLRLAFSDWQRRSPCCVRREAMRRSFRYRVVAAARNETAGARVAAWPAVI
jgi:hypothetical protein